MEPQDSLEARESKVWEESKVNPENQGTTARKEILAHQVTLDPEGTLDCKEQAVDRVHLVHQESKETLVLQV